MMKVHVSQWHVWRTSEGEGEGVKRASAGKNERARHTRGEAGVSLPLPLACFTRSLAPLFFSALACVTPSPSPSDALLPFLT